MFTIRGKETENEKENRDYRGSHSGNTRSLLYRIRGVFPEPLLLWHYDRWH